MFYPVALYGVRGFQVSDIRDDYASRDYLYLRLFTTGVSVALSAILVSFLSVSTTVVLCTVGYTAIRVLEAFADLFFGFFQKRDRFDIIFVSYILKSIGTLAVALLALWFTKSIPLVVAAMGVAFAFAFFFYDLPKAGTMKLGVLNAAHLAALLKKCFPLMAFGFISPYVNFIVRYFVETIHGTEVQGYYSSIAILQAVMSTLTSSIWVVYIPMFVELYQGGNARRLKQIVLRILLLVAVAMAIAIVATIPLARPVLRLVYGPAILPYAYLLLPVVVISGISSVVMLLNTVLIAMGRNTFMLLANAAGAIAITACAHPLVSIFGVGGANDAMLAGLVLQTILISIPVFTVKGKLPPKPLGAC